MRVEARPPCPPAGDRETAMSQLLRSADRLARLTADWYPNEYHFVSEELFAVLLELHSAARKMPPGRCE